jgi:putative transposase
MRCYKRTFVPGATYFFTLNLQNRKSSLLIKHVNALRFAFKKVQLSHPFYIDAIVIMPDHCHLLMTLPETDRHYPKRLSLIKATFSRQIVLDEVISKSRQRKRERGIWQRRYWEHLIRDERDYEHHVNYIHYNPVKHGYVKKPSEWCYSSIHRWIGQGILQENWACSDDFQHLKFGE